MLHAPGLFRTCFGLQQLQPRMKGTLPEFAPYTATMKCRSAVVLAIVYIVQFVPPASSCNPPNAIRISSASSLRRNAREIAGRGRKRFACYSLAHSPNFYNFLSKDKTSALKDMRIRAESASNSSEERAV